MGIGVLFRDAAAALADDNGDLALVIQLRAFRGRISGLPAPVKLRAKRGNSDMFGGAACPSLYSALRSGKLTPTQMIFSGRGTGI